MRLPEFTNIMRDIVQYFDLINTIIENSPIVSAELELEQLDTKRGTVDGTLYFADGSRLEFTERVAIGEGKPVKRAYRYQYIKSQSSVFRYDNAPHHPLLASFPHHKHAGRKTLEAKEPNLKQVIEEAVSITVQVGDSGSQATPRRKRSRKSELPE